MVNLRIAVCIVGHARTFGLDIVRSRLLNVSTDTHGILFLDDKQYNSHQHTNCRLQKIPPRFSIYKNSTCGTFVKQETNRDCYDEVAWLQHAWIKRCFQTFNASKFDVFVRLRPDSFLHTLYRAECCVL